MKQCPVCLETKGPITVLPCDHYFCKPCLVSQLSHLVAQVFQIRDLTYFRSADELQKAWRNEWVGNYNDRVDVQKKFQCPCCRATNPIILGRFNPPVLTYDLLHDNQPNLKDYRSYPAHARMLAGIKVMLQSAGYITVIDLT